MLSLATSHSCSSQPSHSTALLPSAIPQGESARAHKRRPPSLNAGSMWSERNRAPESPQRRITANGYR
eukprot:scaffold203746_cov30-Tisochrysis_lutea.AAC.5